MRGWRRERITSAVFGAVGAAMFAWALASAGASTAYTTLWYLGCALGLFSSALSPGPLFSRVTIHYFTKQGPPLMGGARICAFLGAGCFLLAAILWVVAHV